MVRLCMRSRCDRAAQVRLTYDTLRCRVFLDDLPESPGMYQEICEFHAVRLKLPMGWELSDRRGTTPALFDLEDLVRSATPSAEPIVTRSGGIGTERIDLADRVSDTSGRPVPPRSTRPTRSDVAPMDDRWVTLEPAPASVPEPAPVPTPSHGPTGATGHRSGLREHHARSARGRGPLPTPSELFGVGRLPGVDATADRTDRADSAPRTERGDEFVTVVSVGDRSIETVIVLGPADAPADSPADRADNSDSTGERHRRSL